MKDEYVIGFILLAVAVTKISESKDFIKLKQTTLSLFDSIKSFFQNYAYLSISILSSILFAFCCYIAYRKISQKLEQKRERKKTIEQEKSFIEEFLNKKLHYLNSEELRKLIKELKKQDFLDESIELFKEEFKLKLLEARNILIVLKKKEEVEELEMEKRIVERELEKLDEEKREKELSEQEEKYIIRKKLNIENKNVFKRQRLTKEEINILLKEGYEQTNQYCVKEQKIIPVLVKPILNHSALHTFLVWSVKKLLEEYKGVSNIWEHETKDADITFKYAGKTYAIEIETGTSLRKKKRMWEKVAFLNQKYKNRWLFVISNKDLVGKYRKFGLSTQRKWVCPNLDKMLKNQ